MTRIRIAVALAVMLAPAPPIGGVALARSEARQAPAPTVAVQIRTAGGRTLVYRAEVARTAAEQARGLMFRTGLPARGGMIFPMDPPRPTYFWMKNTLIPLDMIFVRADGRIAMIAERVPPETLDPVGPEGDMAAVLELAGGQARRDGLKVGDRLSWGG